MFGRSSVNDELMDILGGHAGVGLWDAILHDGDPMHVKSRWTWSQEFRRLLGFTTSECFPNVVNSWSDRLHPDDAPTTFAAFGKALSEGSRYDVVYRLRMSDQTYRWFRATGGVVKDAHGVARRACGSLVDVHDGVIARQISEQRVLAVDRLVQEFSSSVSGLTSTLASAALEMESTANSMNSIANRTNSRSAGVAKAALHASTNVQAVATAAEQLTATIRDLDMRILKSSELANQAVEAATRTDTVVQALST